MDCKQRAGRKIENQDTEGGGIAYEYARIVSLPVKQRRGQRNPNPNRNPPSRVRLLKPSLSYCEGYWRRRRGGGIAKNGHGLPQLAVCPIPAEKK